MKLRPHHILCLLLFEPTGHSESYIEGMRSVMKKLKENPEIEISHGLDVICEGCPHRDNRVCRKEDNVQTITQNMLALTNVKAGEKIPWEVLRKKITGDIVKSKFRETCGSCSFFEQCERISLCF